jgi:Tol biopolymer transport system component
MTNARSSWGVGLAALAVGVGGMWLAAGSAAASFPGTNGRIVYKWLGAHSFRGGPMETGIRTVDPRTRRVRVLRSCPLLTGPYAECVVSAPRSTPDGRTIAFPIDHLTPGFTGPPPQHRPALATVAPDGSGLAEEATSHAYAALAWSPTGDRLLVEMPTGVDEARHAVFLTERDGTVAAQLTPPGTRSPDWSTRGQIAFAGPAGEDCPPGCEEIFVTRVGGAPRRLTYRGGSNPSWSPHGTKLAFVRRGDVFIIRRDGRGLRRLTRRGGSSPAWSPDGKRIAFVRNGDLYVVRVRGGARRKLVDGAIDPNGFGEGPQVAAVDWVARP